MSPAELGFGGFNESGIGKENGTEFVHQFTQGHTQTTTNIH